MTIEDQQRLLQALQEHELLRQKGYECTILGGVLIERAGHARGLWRCNSRGFDWTPAGYNEPVHWVDDVEAAVLYTLKVLSSA